MRTCSTEFHIYNSKSLNSMMELRESHNIPQCPLNFVYFYKICVSMQNNPQRSCLKLIADSEPLIKDSYSVSVVSTELSRKCGLSSDTVVTLSSGGVIVARAQPAAFLEWRYINDVRLTDGDKNRTCVVHIDRLVSSLINVSFIYFLISFASLYNCLRCN